jgi:hypothetical protein
MSRKALSPTSWVGLALAVVLAAAGGFLIWGSTYLHNTVHNQLAMQQIYFPPKAAFAHPKAGTEITSSMIPSVSQYAGQQLLTGQQAEAYANNFIAVHLSEMPYHGVYSAISTAARAAKPGSAQATTLSALQQTSFMGTSLRAMLLNAFGWWKVSQIMYIASITAFVLAGLSLIGSGFAFALGRRTTPAAKATIAPASTRERKAA